MDDIYRTDFIELSSRRLVALGSGILPIHQGELLNINSKLYKVIRVEMDIDYRAKPDHSNFIERVFLGD